jgi:hypothetical protein
MSTAKNLAKEPPRSPRSRLGGYIILARMADKGRATLAGTVGEYHFACPLDQMLFDLKGVQAGDVKKLLASGASDEQIVNWFNEQGTKKTAEGIKEWSDGVEAYRPFDDPEKKDWFAGECARLDLKPETSTLFDYLDADDAVSFKK